MQNPPPSRERLPISDPQQQSATALDARDQSPAFQPRQPLRPPQGAPNVVVVLIDDMGYGAPSAFGGPCHMPTA
ncbi:hypothetical protein, partial [Saccharopolyspora halophila]|uniref:hypothetical protein n=1 Tax=Saccharopolyspora halophila TaxID=405551 RepID=UPI0031D12E51